jgi:hypothetical protein
MVMEELGEDTDPLDNCSSAKWTSVQFVVMSTRVTETHMSTREQDHTPVMLLFNE